MLLILGEHDKGTGIPFHPATVSGKRLRKILAEIKLDARLENVYEIDERGQCTPNNLVEMADGDPIVVLGRIAEEECKRQGVAVTYLPHPAVRVQSQLDQLKAGLLKIKESEASAKMPTTEEFLGFLPAIRDAARNLGYAVGLHGSLARDFDLIAVPWIENAADPDDVAEAIKKVTGCVRWRCYRDQGTPKPHGRLAYAFDWDEKNYDNRGYIDLSVMPRNGITTTTG